MLRNMQGQLMSAINFLNVAWASGKQRFEAFPKEVMEGVLDDVALVGQMTGNYRKDCFLMFSHLILSGLEMRQWALDVFISICDTLKLPVDCETFGLIMAVGLKMATSKPKSRMKQGEVCDLKIK